MYLTTVAILTIIIMVFLSFFPETFSSGMGFWAIFFGSFIAAAIAAVPIWVVWRAFRGVKSLKKKKKED